MTLTIIHDLYIMDQGPLPIGNQFMWWIPSENLDPCGGEKGLYLCKRIVSVM